MAAAGQTRDTLSQQQQHSVSFTNRTIATLSRTLVLLPWPNPQVTLGSVKDPRSEEMGQ